MTSAELRRRGPRGPYAKTAQRREAIVEAAHRVFASRGYTGGSFQDVADEVGMSQTSLLYYFPTKSDLLVAALDRRDAITDELSQSHTYESMTERVVRQVEHNARVAGVLQLYTVLCGESVTEGHPAHAYFVNRFRTLRKEYSLEFSELARAGQLRAGVDPERASASLIAMWDGLQTQWLMAPNEVDVAGCLRDYLELLILAETQPES